VPELPEVETTARGLQARIVGLRVVGVGSVDWPRMLPQTTESDLRDTLVGRTVLSVGRRGKYLLVEFDGDAWLMVHRKMSGNLLLGPADAPPERHTHFEISFDGGSALRLVDPRKFGRVYLFHSSDEMTDFLAERLGPDSLLELDPRVFAEKLRGRRGRIKSLLLDQSFIAGIGNLYADEALWQAKIHPLRTADSLSPREVRALGEAIHDVLAAAIERRGTSFSDYRDADGTRGENQDYLNVYGRGGQACPRCGTILTRIFLGQRSSTFCPKDQKLLTRRAASGNAPRSGTAPPPPGGTPPAATAPAPRAAGSRR
jgi:formamidopyrimidine-DNA glycosylase